MICMAINNTSAVIAIVATEVSETEFTSKRTRFHDHCDCLDSWSFLKAIYLQPEKNWPSQPHSYNNHAALTHEIFSNN